MPAILDALTHSSPASMHQKPLAIATTSSLQRSNTPVNQDIVVIGAGIIGVSCALALARRGYKVCLIDRQEVGAGASYGNAGHLAVEQVFPIADASILRRIPSMLMDPMGPLRLDWRYLPRAFPWLARLLVNLRRAPFQRSIAGLRALNERSLTAWQHLLESIHRTDLLQHHGSVVVFERESSLPEALALLSRMRQQQVRVEQWSADQLRKAAPQLSSHLRGGLFFPETAHVIDPHRVTIALAEAARQLGVQFLQCHVLSAQRHSNSVTLQTNAGPMQASRVLLACGAHSADLAKMLTGIRVPLETERGYHLMLPHETGRLPFAVTSLERKFIMTPMVHGLRLAGTVEFAGLNLPANMERAWQLLRHAKTLFQHTLNDADATPWMGFRPSLPDSLPIIDRTDDGIVMLAFGHQHLGLTQAAVTANIVADMAQARTRPQIAQDISLTCYRMDRF